MPVWAERLPELPTRLKQSLEDLAAVRQHMADHAREMRRLRREIRNSNRRTIAMIAAATCILSAVTMLASSGVLLAVLDQMPPLAWALGGLGMVLLLYAWLKR